jgi:hypothetical protein
VAGWAHEEAAVYGSTIQVFTLHALHAVDVT